MFKHRLSPTVGAALSTTAIRHCLAYAKQCGAEVVGLHVVRTLRSLVEGREVPGIDPNQYRDADMINATLYLAEIGRAAREFGVARQAVAYNGHQPYDMSIRTVREQGCDLICMAPQGRRGVAGLLLGSATQKIVTHTALTVLVAR